MKFRVNDIVELERKKGIRDVDNLCGDYQIVAEGIGLLILSRISKSYFHDGVYLGIKNVNIVPCNLEEYFDIKNHKSSEDKYELMENKCAFTEVQK